MKMNLRRRTTKSMLIALSLASILGVAFNIESALACPVSYPVIGPPVWSYEFQYSVGKPGPDPTPLPGGIADGFCFDKMTGVVNAWVEGSAAAAGWTVGLVTPTTVVFDAKNVAPGLGPWTGFCIYAPGMVDGPVDWFCDHGAGAASDNDLAHGPNPPDITKTLSTSEGELGDVVHVTISVDNPGYWMRVTDTLPPEWECITGTFKVNGVSATPSVTLTPPPPPRSQVISYRIIGPGSYIIEFDAKVTSTYWEDRTVVNRATVTWHDALCNLIGQKEVTANFIIHAFKQLHKNVGIPKKVKVIPAPVQFWRQFIGGVTDVIVSDPPDWLEGVALVRDYAVLRDGEGSIPLERLTWQDTAELPWQEIDKDRDGDGKRDPYILMRGETAEFDIHTTDVETAVLVRYTVAWESTPDVIEAHFVNEAILENHSPQVIVGQLSNFDVHNDYHEPVDNFELELYGIQPSDIVDWFPGWGTPPQINPIPGGTEIIWKGPPVPPCQWVHFGLHLKPGVIATGVKAHWTQMVGGSMVIKEKTETQWIFTIEVTNPFPYTMTNVVITDRLGAELEIDQPFPYSITHGTASYTLHGKSKQVHLTWNIGNLLPRVTARLIILVSTDLNPAGKQEYTTPGIYTLNSGATLKFIDPEQNMQLSAVTAPIYVTVLPAEDP